MEPMLRRSLFRLSVFVAGFCLVVSSLAAGAQQDKPTHSRKYKAPRPTARIEVTVMRDINGKPIENAAVIFHPMAGEKDKGVMELKTNDDGKTIIDVLPIGDTVRLQVIARGFQTYGEDFAVDKAEMALEIRMKRPGEQYSIYKNRPETPRGGKDSGAEKDASPSKDAPPNPSQSQPQPK
jgi:5-hydroxyisourate hydrolase-like protein (transthyretin family)